MKFKKYNLTNYSFGLWIFSLLLLLVNFNSYEAIAEYSQTCSTRLKKDFNFEEFSTQKSTFLQRIEKGENLLNENEINSIESQLAFIEAVSKFKDIDLLDLENKLKASKSLQNNIRKIFSKYNVQEGLSPRKIDKLIEFLYKQANPQGNYLKSFFKFGLSQTSIEKAIQNRIGIEITKSNVSAALENIGLLRKNRSLEKFGMWRKKNSLLEKTVTTLVLNTAIYYLYGPIITAPELKILLNKKVTPEILHEAKTNGLQAALTKIDKTWIVAAKADAISRLIRKVAVVSYVSFFSFYMVHNFAFINSATEMEYVNHSTTEVKNTVYKNWLESFYEESSHIDSGSFTLEKEQALKDIQKEEVQSINFKELEHP